MTTSMSSVLAILNICSPQRHSLHLGTLGLDPLLCCPEMVQTHSQNYNEMPQPHPLLVHDMETSTDETSILDLFQSGFCPSHGTEAVVVALTDKLHRQPYQHRLVLLLLLDPTAVLWCFDSQLVADMGVHVVALKWFPYFSCARDTGWHWGRECQLGTP